MVVSLLLHKVGLAADSSTASDYTWAYQITGIVKHGAELAGWMLLATGIVAGIEGRAAREVTPAGSLRLETNPWRDPCVRGRSFGAHGCKWRAGCARRRLRPSPRKTISPQSVDTDDAHEKVEKAMLNGLMMDDFQLSLTVLVERAERTEFGAPGRVSSS